MGYVINTLNNLRAGSRKRRARPTSINLQENWLCVERLEERTVLTAGWVTTISGAANEFVNDLVGDAAGNTYVTGKFSSQPSTFGNIALTSDGLGDIFVAKQNANGQYLWATNAGNSTSGNDTSNGVAVDAAGNVFITGYFEGTAQFGTQSLTSAGGYDVFVAKLDGSSGQFLWAQQRGGSGYDRGNAIAIDPSGNLLVSGGFDAVSSSDAPVVFVSKFATDGTELWTSTATGSMTGALFSVAVDAATGEVYAGGRFQGTAQFPTGTLVSSAYLPSAFGSVSSDALITKLDQGGHWLWARQLAGDTHGSVRSTTVASGGQLYVTGQFEGTVNFDSTSLTSAGSRDGFVTQIAPATGSVSWARRVGGSDYDNLQDVKVDPQGNVNVVGTFRGTADFGPQILAADGTGAIIENAFVTKLDPAGTFLETHRFVTGTNNPVIVAGLSIDAAGNVYIGGWSAGGTVQFPQQPVSGSYSTGYVVKLPPSAATKFYVVNDASSDRTYQYAAGGNLTIDNFGLNTGNTAPRGAVSNATGSTVWVADKNRNVYVYSNSGALQGSWTASSLSSTAVVEGVATNGTDVWIVDNKTDKVFKHTGAASRIYGSQSAASSFSLNNANTNPKGIVTDGTYIWVLNDSSTDKIFKYTVSGSFQGSWTIDSANASPTGLTIDPTNGSQDIWVVDNGTDKIYQYANSRSRTSSSGQVASSATYALAVGNTNPQGIADPPPPSAASPMGTSPDLKSPGVGPTPMPWLSEAAFTVGAATTQQVQTRARQTDEFMSILGDASEQPKATVSVGRMTTVEPDKSIDRNARVKASIEHDSIDDLIGLVAKDLWR